MFGYVKKDTLLDNLREEIDFCGNMTEKYERIIEALYRDNASPIMIQTHEEFLADWKTRWHQSIRILSMLERA